MSRKQSREAKLDKIRKLKVEIKRIELEIELEDYKARMSDSDSLAIDPEVADASQSVDYHKPKVVS